MNADNTTPRPWRFDTIKRAVTMGSTRDRMVRTVDGEIVASLDGDIATAQANAALIVRAVNSHDALRDALAEMLADAETMREPYRNEAICERARAALALAEDEGAT